MCMTRQVIDHIHREALKQESAARLASTKVVRNEYLRSAALFKKAISLIVAGYYAERQCCRECDNRFCRELRESIIRNGFDVERSVHLIK